MTTWMLILGILWIGMLIFFSIRSYQQTDGADDYIFAGSSIGTLVGVMTFAATLFSTFTLMGMPDFFRNHGVGAWIFLAVSDAVMFFLIIGFGFHLRKRGQEKGYRGVAGLLVNSYESRWAGYVYFTGIFLFLIPYVAIQIRGLAIFLSAIFPELIPAWGWSVGIVFLMLLYSEVGGLRTIIYSDFLQASILLTVIWVIAVVCVQKIGGIPELFAAAKAADPALLSTPGPKGLFSPQFLIGSFFAIVMIPVTQPQVTTRLVIMENKQKLHRMAVSLGVITFLILFPIIAIGLYGGIKYGGATTREYLSQVLLFEQPEIVAAAVVIGLLAAAVSTSDSQIFALGTELRSMLRQGNEKKSLRITRIAIMFFGICALIFSIISSDELVMLARVSFAGTAIMGPMIIAAIFYRKNPGYSIIGLTALALLLFLLSLLKVIPEHYGPFRLDLLLFVILGVYTTGMVGMKRLRSYYAE